MRSVGEPRLGSNCSGLAGTPSILLGRTLTYVCKYSSYCRTRSPDRQMGREFTQSKRLTIAQIGLYEKLTNFLADIYVPSAQINWRI